MTPELDLLAGQRQRDRLAAWPQPRRTAAGRSRRALPLVPRSSNSKGFPMNTWHIDTSIQLQIAEQKREEMLRAGLIRQQLLEQRTRSSPVIALRMSLSHVLIALGQAIRPNARADEWADSPRIAA